MIFQLRGPKRSGQTLPGTQRVLIKPKTVKNHQISNFFFSFPVHGTTIELLHAFSTLLGEATKKFSSKSMITYFEIFDILCVFFKYLTKNTKLIQKIFKKKFTIY